MNYAIFRSEPIYTLNDLAQVGAHNKREKNAYKSNPDINRQLTKNNIELVPLDKKYVKGFHELTIEYKKEHDERMKTEREDRKRTYSQMLDRSKNVVADNLIFTASPKFFKDMPKEEILRWGKTCMDFVYRDLGYKKEQVLHSTIHMDEKTPHIHCVVIPLVKKFDKRTNTERYTISKKQYITDNIHLSELQDKYCNRLNRNGFRLERGIKYNDTEHIKIKKLKKLTNKLNKQLVTREDSLEKIIKELTKNMEFNKEIMLDSNYIKVKKETIKNVHQLINESKKINELQPKIKNTYESFKYYSDNYSKIYKENEKMKIEIGELKYSCSYSFNKGISLMEKTKQLEGTINKMSNFVYQLVALGYVPRRKKEEFEAEFSEFISGKKKDKDHGDL